MQPTLALDLATKTGWAHTSGPSGVQDFKPRRGDSPGMRWLNFNAWLTRIHAMEAFSLAAYEQPHYRGGHATEVLAGFVAALQQWAAKHDVELTSRHSSEIKRHATWKGNATKVAMLAAAHKRWPDVEIIDDNHADALFLLDLIQHELDL